jgi:integrase
VKSSSYLAPGIRRHGAGYQATVKVRGERDYAQFDLNTPLSEMLEWQKDRRAELRVNLPKTPAGTFAADAKKYLALPSVLAMPTYAERVQHITEWVEIFGGRRRRSIKPPEIEAQRDAWLTEPRQVDDAGTVLKGPYSAGAVNKRLRALSNVWTKLDGRRAPNPVREVDECEEPDPEPRGLPYAVVEAIIAAMPETAVGVKKDGTRTTGKNVARPSQTKARLRVIAYTGLPHQTLRVLRREHLTLFSQDSDGQETGGTILVPARRKGRRARRAKDKPLPHLIPLIPQAAAAFREFDRLDCWTKPGEHGFSGSSMWKSFQAACKTLGLEGLTPKDFRHSYLTLVYAETKDLRVTGHLGMHRTESTPKRYTIAAVAPHVQAAADRVAAALASSSGVHRSESLRKDSDKTGRHGDGPVDAEPSKSL